MFAPVNSGGDNLNDISYKAAFGAVKRIFEAGFKVKRIIADQVGPPEVHKRRMREFLGSLLPSDVEVICESKADDKYPVVSAASICAKVSRDQILAGWDFEEKQTKPFSSNFGCGYPGDPVTKQWLQDHYDEVFGFPTVVRFSWKTCKTILDDRKTSGNWHDPDPKVEQKLLDTKNALTNFFVPTS